MNDALGKGERKECHCLVEKGTQLASGLMGKRGGVKWPVKAQLHLDQERNRRTPLGGTYQLPTSLQYGGLLLPQYLDSTSQARANLLTVLPTGQHLSGPVPFRCYLNRVAAVRHRWRFISIDRHFVALRAREGKGRGAVNYEKTRNANFVMLSVKNTK